MNQRIEGTSEVTSGDFAQPRVDVATAELAKAFNEWMRRYIENPEQFEAEFRSVKSFEVAAAKGEEPDYGTRVHGVPARSRPRRPRSLRASPCPRAVRFRRLIDRS